MNKKNYLHVKTGDLVKIIAGDDKGKTGTILKVQINKCAVKVSGIKILTHFNKADKGGIVKKEGWIHASNVKKDESKNE